MNSMAVQGLAGALGTMPWYASVIAGVVLLSVCGAGTAVVSRADNEALGCLVSVVSLLCGVAGFWFLGMGLFGS